MFYFLVTLKFTLKNVTSFWGLAFCLPASLLKRFGKLRLISSVAFFSYRFKNSKWKPMDFCFVLLYMRNFEKKVVVVVWKKTIDVDGWKNVMGIRKTSGELKSSSVANTKNKNKSFLCFVNYTVLFNVLIIKKFHLQK